MVFVLISKCTSKVPMSKECNHVSVFVILLKRINIIEKSESIETLFFGVEAAINRSLEKLMFEALL